jgi:hypothetical protein
VIRARRLASSRSSRTTAAEVVLAQALPLLLEVAEGRSSGRYMRHEAARIAGLAEDVLSRAGLLPVREAARG